MQSTQTEKKEEYCVIEREKSQVSDSFFLGKKKGGEGGLFLPKEEG